MTITFGGHNYRVVVWSPAMKPIGSRFAFDTETAAIVPHETPPYVIGQAFNGEEVFFIQRQDLPAFWSANSEAVVDLHTASFDLAVVTKASGFSFADMIERGQLRDVSILFRLLALAKTGTLPRSYALDAMCQECLKVILEKPERIRLGFGEFLNDGRVDYRRIPAEHLRYAALDAVATYKLASLLEPQCREVHLRHAQSGVEGTPPWGWLGHDIQLRGGIALREIERLGLMVDPAAVEALDARLEAEVRDCQDILGRYGYVPGKSGNQDEYDRVIADIERSTGIAVPSTAKNGQKSQAADALAPLAGHEFIAAFLRAKEVDKLRKTYLRGLQASGGRIHPHYSLMVRTGRTSCSSPNVQNLPRHGGVRECIVPSPGHVFIAADYAGLELCCLSQITYTKYGFSHMRELINDGVDLHRHAAAMILSKEPGDVTAEERQKAKAVNFGVPGGMTGGGLQAYAANLYRVTLSSDEAERWRERWLDLFPEMRRYLNEDKLQRVAEALDLSAHPDAMRSPDPMVAAALVMRVAGGKRDTSKGRVFGSEEIEWAWQQIELGPAAERSDLAEIIIGRRGSRDLQRAIVPTRTVSIATGRACAGRSFTEACNWPFQALAADGAKLALYDLHCAGYRVVAFIHDEVLVEVPERDDYRPVSEDISRIMVDAMRRVCPDVKIRAEYAVMRRWSKGASATYTADGRLIPYEDRAVEKPAA